jgi:Mg-chelatase subunit ChlD
MLETNRARIRQLAVFAVLVGATALVAAHRPEASPDPGPTSRRAPKLSVVAPPEGAARIEVAFVLDTTGSMSGLIEGAKHKIWSIANQMASGQPRPEIRIGLVGYRDRGDAYVTRLHDLTQDIDAVYAELFAYGAAGGGDTPESVNQALHDAVTRLDWSMDPSVYRVVFLVGDAPPHLDYPGDVPYAESLRLARQRDIVVNTIQCGNLATTTPIWQEIASSGQGQYVSIAQDGAMLAVTTPHDEELARLNAELAGTALAYGDADARESFARKLKGALSAPAAVAASRLSYLEKSGSGVSSGRGDLVDALAAGEVSLEDLSDEELPAALRPLEPAEQAAYVEGKRREREALQEKVQELSRQRDAYVKSELERREVEGEADGFDTKVLGTIRDQAARKGIAYE